MSPADSPICWNILKVHVKFQKGDWAAEKVITVPSKKVEGWALPEMPGIR